MTEREYMLVESLGFTLAATRSLRLVCVSNEDSDATENARVLAIRAAENLLEVIRLLIPKLEVTD